MVLKTGEIQGKYGPSLHESGIFCIDGFSVSGFSELRNNIGEHSVRISDGCSKFWRRCALLLCKFRCDGQDVFAVFLEAGLAEAFDRQEFLLGLRNQ